MKLYAISDLHLGYKANRKALQKLRARPDDWLILAGDAGESLAHLKLALDLLCARFQQVLWVPGNHDLWTLPTDTDGARGQAKYLELVSMCRSYGVLTPEDPYPLWTGEGGPCVLAPMFLLYDYSFRPQDVSAEAALAWAMETGIVCADENFLHPDPYRTRAEWCASRCRLTLARLKEAAKDDPVVLINHWPLRADLVHLPAVPRFCLWCGTRRTEDWHRRFRTAAVVYGHLHIRTTTWRDGVRFEEVSQGYPHQWQAERGLDSLLREILPGPQASTARTVP